MKSKSYLIFAFLFIGSFIWGLVLMQRSWDGVTYSFSSDKRSPAAIQKVFDFSHLEGQALEIASKKRLLQGAKVSKSDEEISIELGHFVMKTRSGNKAFACNTYNKIEMVFKSTNQAVSGEPVLMIVSGQCQFDNDIHRISAIKIPVAKILNEKVGDVELQYFEKNSVHIKFENTGDSWPHRWALYSLKMYDESNLASEFVVDSNNINEFLQKPLRISWTQ